MVNRIIIILLILLIIGIGIVIFEFRFSKKDVSPAEEYIPKRAALVLKANGLLHLMSSLNEHNFLCPNYDIECDFEVLYKKLDSLSVNNEKIGESLNDNSVWFAFLPSKEKNGFLALIPIENNISSDVVEDNIVSLFSGFGKNCTEYSPGLKTGPEVNSWYYLHENGLLILSNRAELIQESLVSNSDQQTIVRDSSFNKVYGTSGANAPATLYINFNQSSEILNLLFKKEFSAKISGLTSKSGWMALDLNTSGNSVILQGFSFSHTNGFMLSSILKSEQAVENSFLQTVPENAAFISYVCISDPYNFIHAKDEFIRKNKTYKEKIDEINENAGFSVDEKLSELVSTVAGQVICAEKSKFYSYFLVKTTGAGPATDFLKSLSTDSAKFNDTIRYFNLKHNRIPYIIAADAIGETKYAHAFIYNEYIVFADTEEALGSYFYKLQHSQMLSNDSLFVKAARELVLSKSNLNSFLFPSKLLNFASDWIKDSAFSKIQEQLKNQKILLGLQASGGNPLVYFNTFLYRERNDSARVDIEWQIETDTSIAKLEHVAVNGSSYYFVQDLMNTIYFVSSYGRVQWKKKLDKPIISTIHSIDFYKNGKTQMLFNTSEDLFLIDRNGNFVEDFPVKFKNRATNGVEVADFENDKNYRYYIAFENKTFIALDKSGKKISGWNFGKTNDLVKKQAVSFTHQAKDYIAFFDSTQVYLLNRRGEDKLNRKPQLITGENSELFVEHKNLYFRVAIVDVSSKVHFFYPNGKSETREDNLMYDNSALAVLNDGYALYDSSKLIIYSRDGLQKSRYTLEEPVHGLLNTGKYYHDTEVLVFSYKSRKQINAIDAYGKMLKAFPIFGDYPFIFISLYNGSGTRILCSSGNTLFNYSLP